MFLDDYFMLRKKNQKDLRYEFANLISSQEEPAVSLIQIKKLLKDYIPNQSISPVLLFGSDIIFARAYLFGIICGKNDDILTAD